MLVEKSKYRSGYFSNNKKKIRRLFTHLFDGTTIRTIRDRNWKLFLSKPEYYKEIDLKNWKDERGPDGTTIIAPFVQAPPADYQEIKPLKMEGEMLLFDVAKDPSEPPIYRQKISED